MKNKIDYMDRIKNQSRNRPVLFCMIAIIILCICIIYSIPLSQTTTMKPIVTHPSKSIHSSEQLCYSPRNSVFLRNHLRQLVIDKFDNGSAYVSTSDALKQPLISQNY